MAQISKAIGPATHNEAEYQALIEGLELAHDHGIQRIRVYMDSELVVDQVNGVSVTCSPVSLSGQAAGVRWVDPPSFKVAATSSGVW